MTRRLLLAAAVGLLVTPGCSAAPRTAAKPPTTAVSDAPNPADAGEDGPYAAASAPPPRSAVLAAVTYTKAWARPALPQGAWFAAVSALVTPAYAQLLSSTNPANVPAQNVTGEPVVVSSTTAVVIADVPTDAGRVRVTVANMAGRWLVATAEPAPEPR